jgi:hypothetical protein
MFSFLNHVNPFLSLYQRFRLLFSPPNKLPKATLPNQPKRLASGNNLPVCLAKFFQKGFFKVDVFLPLFI